jgi:hypothetical protein
MGKSNIATLRSILERRVAAWGGVYAAACAMERFVLAHGLPEATGSPLGDGHKPGEAKACFSNATKLALADNRLRYVEGFGMRVGLMIPIHHAWCVYEDGQVVDPTWRDPEACRYLGVVFERETLIAQMLKWEVYGVLDPGHGANVELMAEFSERSKTQEA